MPSTMEVSLGTIRSIGDQGGDLTWEMAPDPGGSQSLHELRIKNGETVLPTVQLQSGPSGVPGLRGIDDGRIKWHIVDGSGATLYQTP